MPLAPANVSRMKHLAFAVGLLLAATPVLADPIDDQAAALRDAGLEDALAFDITEGLTTEVGPRLAGTEAEARARNWAVERLTALGFSNVRVEPFQIPGWVRGVEKAEVVSPYPQPLVLAALGNSGATPAGGVHGEVVAFADLDALKAAPEETIKGRIVFITHRMRATQDGSSYGAFGIIRRQGPAIAAAKSAAAILIRSIGTDYHRNPHTGSVTWPEGTKPIPAAALTLPDSEQLERMLARGRPIVLRLTLTPRFVGPLPSGNVIAEIPGRDPNAGVVVVGGHIDSWDLGTGAIDDATGVAVTTAAAKLVMDAGQPRRTIRVVWFGAEEPGVYGGEAYFAAHKDERHAVASESDFGAGRIWQLDSQVGPGGRATVARIARALEPLGIARGSTTTRGGADVAPLSRVGVPIISLRQDGSDYFDLHHTPDDTLDKVDPAALRQNVAAWAAMLSIVANVEEPLGPVQP